MVKINRRQFAKKAGVAAFAASALGSSPLGTSLVGSFAYAQGKGKVVIIGGGAGGGTVAHLIKRQAPDLDVTLVEVNPHYTTCFFSNLYLGGLQTLGSLVHGYDGLKKLGIKIIHDMALDVDTKRKTVFLKGGEKLTYDKLVLSPGIDFKWENIEGYTPGAAQKMPHAWKAGVQTKILKNQLEGLRDGGLVVMSAPPDPFRCPPGPYERASMIAHYLKTHKPKSKLIIFDPKAEFALMNLFQQGWERHYGDIIEWIGTDFTDGGIKKVDPDEMTVTTGDGETIKADVVNIIPGQKAGLIAHAAGCAEGDWCPIKPQDFSSLKVKDVYVLGDSSMVNKAKDFPKSASLANSQAKIVANSILAEFVGETKLKPSYFNVCWSLLSPENCVKYASQYEPNEKTIKITSGFLSALSEDKDVRKQTYLDSIAWYSAITSDMFAKG